MFKRIVAAINRILLLSRQPSMTLSQEWRENQLSEYEKQARNAAGLW
jgi:hypothetical protein